MNILPEASNLEGIVSRTGTMVPSSPLLLIHIPAIRPSTWNTIGADELLRLTRERRGVHRRLALLFVERYGESFDTISSGSFVMNTISTLESARWAEWWDESTFDTNTASRRR